MEALSLSWLSREHEQFRLSLLLGLITQAEEVC